MAQQEDSLTESVLARILHGLSIRGYAEMLGGKLDSCGTSKGRVSARFVHQMQAALEERLHQRLDGQVFVALRVDGVHPRDHTVLAALGVTADGQKTVLGLQEGATENEAAARTLLEDLVEWGLSYDQGFWW